MLTIEPTGAVLGATVRGIDLARPLREPDLGRILLALGKHGVKENGKYIGSPDAGQDWHTEDSAALG
jgi:hypothetical protein